MQLDLFRSIFKTGSLVSDGEAVLNDSIKVHVENPMQLVEFDNQMSESSVWLNEHCRLQFPNWPKNLNLFLSLFESPDFFANRYRREGLKAFLFIGVVKNDTLTGAIWCDNAVFSTHGELMRGFKSNSPSIHHMGDTKGGTPDVYKSGAILPTQSGVENTYVSLWTKCEDVMKDYINQLLLQHPPKAPVLLDRNVGTPFLGPFEVVPWDSN